MSPRHSSGPRHVARAAETERIAAIFSTLAATINPKSDLEYGSPFELLVAVVLSAQATDKSVNEATRKLYPVANTPQAIFALGVDGLKPYIRHIGLFNTKAANVIELCRLLIERHGGHVPDTRAELEALPGVGHKTASVVLNVAFGQPTIAVDTHVQRVANRLGLCATTTPNQTEAALLALTPKEHLLHAHHYLILHGRYCCTARAPQCDRCPVAQWCPSVGVISASGPAPR
jgi:endonuclease-3